MLNDSNEGGDWKEHGVDSKQVLWRQQGTRPGSEKLYEVVVRMIRDNVEKGNLPE